MEKWIFNHIYWKQPFEMKTSSLISNQSATKIKYIKKGKDYSSTDKERNIANIVKSRALQNTYHWLYI